MRSTWLCVTLAAACGVGSAGPVQAAPPGEVGLAGALKWVDRHVIPYTINLRYETGRRDSVFGRLPAGALAMYSFDLPPGNTAEPFLGRYKRCMLYDTALGVILLSLAERREKARGLLVSLEHLQNADGSLGFGWNSDGDGYHNMNYVRTGSVAWAGYAAVIHEHMSKDKRFRPFAERVAGFVLRQQVDKARGDDPNDPRRGLVTGGRGVWASDYSRFDAAKVMTWACTEHALDSYFLLRDLGRLTGKARYTGAAETLKQAMLRTLWCEKEGRFYAGIAADGTLDREHALDASSWGAIFLAAVGEEDKARRALAYVEKTYRTAACGAGGYKAYAGHYSNHSMTDWGPDLKMVWSEGSLGVALARLRLGDVEACRRIEREIAAGMQVAGGGVRYSVYRDDLPLPASAVTLVRGRRPTDPLADFVRCPTAAGTVWLGLVEHARTTKSTVFWGKGLADR